MQLKFKLPPRPAAAAPAVVPAVVMPKTTAAPPATTTGAPEVLPDPVPLLAALEKHELVFDHMNRKELISIVVYKTGDREACRGKTVKQMRELAHVALETPPPSAKPASKAPVKPFRITRKIG